MKNNKCKISIARLVIVWLILLIPVSAYADCANPVGAEGDQIYNADHKTMQFCDGTNWWAMKSGSGGALDNLSDVDVPNPGDGQILMYSAGASAWTSGTAGGGGASCTASLVNCSWSGFSLSNSCTGSKVMRGLNISDSGPDAGEADVQCCDISISCN